MEVSFPIDIHHDGIPVLKILASSATKNDGAQDEVNQNTSKAKNLNQIQDINE